jgi:NAD-dependent deacetylase
MVVYPAAGLINYVPDDTMKYVVDPKKPEINLGIPNVRMIVDKASTGMEVVKRELLELIS